MDYSEWLEKEKGLSHKVSHDVNSRLRRVCQILSSENIDDKTLALLEANANFRSLSMTVKSQLRRSVRLYIEYQAK